MVIGPTPNVSIGRSRATVTCAYDFGKVLKNDVARTCEKTQPYRSMFDVFPPRQVVRELSQVNGRYGVEVLQQLREI